MVIALLAQGWKGNCLDRSPSLCLCLFLRLCLSLKINRLNRPSAYVFRINVVTSKGCSEKDQVVLKYDDFQEWPSVEQN